MMRSHLVSCLAGCTCFFFLSATSCLAQQTTAAPPVTPLTVRTLDVTASATSSNWEPVAQSHSATRHVKKKILATAFAINKPAQVADMDHIEQGFPRELLRNLEQSRHFLVRSSSDLLSFTAQTEAPGQKLVKQVAAENDSQFVISGEIRNAGVQIEKKYWGMWSISKRHIEIELAVYDGVSGALLARHLLHQQAQGEAKVGRDKPFGSAVFYATGYGKAIAALLDESASLIASDLESHAALAKIIKIGNGQIVIDAGKSSAIAAGDLASVAVANNELPTLGLKSSQTMPLVYGVPHTIVGKVAIIQAQQLFSVGELSAEVKADDVKVGDFVRFDNVMAN